MAEDTQQSSLTSPFPAPPTFHQSFTPSALSLLQSHLSSTSHSPLTTFNPLVPTTGTLPTTTTTPTDLQPLIPPPIPPSYRSFNNIHYSAAPPPSSLPAPPTQTHLLTLIHKILLKFLHITHILSIDPSMKFYGPAWDELEALFKEMHEGVNAWRPHQARETLIGMMETQVKELGEETKRVRETVGRARGVVEGIGKAGERMDGQMGDRKEVEKSKGQRERERRKGGNRGVWAHVEREVGRI